MAHVADVNRSLRFYALLGFSCESRFSGHDGVPYFARIEADRARLMLVRASGPVDPRQQAVLFYMYSPDVAGLREHLLKQGLADGGKPPGEYAPGDAPSTIPDREAVFNVVKPFYMPDGEIRIHDPDGYCILVGQLPRSCPEPGR